MLVSLSHQLDRLFKAVESIFTLHCRQQQRHFHNSSCKEALPNYYLLCLLFRALPIKVVENQKGICNGYSFLFIAIKLLL